MRWVAPVPNMETLHVQFLLETRSWNLLEPSLETWPGNFACRPCLGTLLKNPLGILLVKLISLGNLVGNLAWKLYLGTCLENLGKLSGEPAVSPHSIPLLGEKCKLTQVEPLCQAALIISQLQAWQKHENRPEIARDKVETGAESQQMPWFDLRFTDVPKPDARG